MERDVCYQDDLLDDLDECLMEMELLEVYQEDVLQRYRSLQQRLNRTVILVKEGISYDAATVLEDLHKASLLSLSQTGTITFGERLLQWLS